MPRVLLFGALGPYSKAFSRTLAARAEVIGCIVRRPLGSGLERLFRYRPFGHEVTGFACPVISLGGFDRLKSYAKLLEQKPDLVVVAGFPRRLPAALIGRLGRVGAVNVHPALLPADRGPAPLFWALRRGDAQTGVTVHALSEELDQGDILCRARMDLPFGADGIALLEQLGALGGELVADQLKSLVTEPWHLTPQGPGSGAWARKPKHEDLRIEPSEWKARHLFSFVRGARVYGKLWARLADEAYYFADAIDFREGRKVPGEFVVIGPNLILSVSDGTVSFKLLD